MFNTLFLLWYFSIISLILVILSRTPVHSVLFGVCFYIFFGGTLIHMGYDIVGIILILVYAGALMVMFLFVVMAFDLTRDSYASSVRTLHGGVRSWGRAVIVLAVFIILLKVYVCVWHTCLEFNYRRTVSLFNCGAEFYGVVVSGCPVASSLVNDLGVLFYQCFPVPLVLCGFMIIIGLVGSVSLAGVFRILPVKRRGVQVPVRSTRFSYRVVVLRR